MWQKFKLWLATEIEILESTFCKIGEQVRLMQAELRKVAYKGIFNEFADVNQAELFLLDLLVREVNVMCRC